MKDYKVGDRVIRRVTGEHGMITAVRDAVEKRPRVGRFVGDDLGDQGFVHMGEFDYENEPVEEAETESSAAEGGVSRTYVSKGGGYYDLLEDGQDVGTVRGKARAQEWVEGE